MPEFEADLHARGENRDRSERGCGEPEDVAAADVAETAGMLFGMTREKLSEMFHERLEAIFPPSSPETTGGLAQ